MRTAGFLVCALAAALSSGVPAAQASAIERQSRALNRASDAVLGLHVQAVDDARSAATLGSERQGSGVVIGSDGLVLTIGYLILEADQVDLVTDDDHHVPARVVGYDVATGFGLVQALAPLKRVPVPLGSAARLSPDEPLVVVSGGVQGRVGPAQLSSRHGFSGFWEYHVDNALFTSPPRPDIGGAALFNLRGELVGIGSLSVDDVNGGDNGATTEHRPGDMFVPVDLLKPILAELRIHGHSHASDRAWIGVNCVDTGGQIHVVRVNDDSPADVAGLQPGDRILRIDGQPVDRLEALWKRLWAGDRAERAVRLEIERAGVRQTLTVQTVDRAKTLRRAQGI